MGEDPILEQLRAICLAFPEAAEGAGVGSPTFRVRDRIFAMRHGAEGRPSLRCKAPRGFQQVLIDSDPEAFFVPPYVGQHGWVGIWLDRDLDWKHIAELIEESYCLTAPKRLIKQLQAGGRANPKQD